MGGACGGGRVGPSHVGVRITEGGTPVIIDSHVHLKHGNAERTEYRAEQIVQAMDDAGVERSIVFAMCTTTRASIDMAAAAVGEYPERLVAYAYALPHPERPILGDIEDAVRNRGFRGIKIHRGECTLAPYVSDPVIALAGRLRVPCLMHFTGADGELACMAAAFPQTRIIAAHLGSYLCTQPALIDRFLRIAAAHRNVYLDISGVVLLEKIRDAVATVGAERVLWGSDGPYPAPTLGDYVATDIRKVRAAGLADQDLTAVLGGSCAALLGL